MEFINNHKPPERDVAPCAGSCDARDAAQRLGCAIWGENGINLAHGKKNCIPDVFATVVCNLHTVQANLPWRKLILHPLREQERGYDGAVPPSPL